MKNARRAENIERTDLAERAVTRVPHRQPVRIALYTIAGMIGITILPVTIVAFRTGLNTYSFTEMTVAFPLAIALGLVLGCMAFPINLFCLEHKTLVRAMPIVFGVGVAVTVLFTLLEPPRLMESLMSVFPAFLAMAITAVCCRFVLNNDPRQVPWPDCPRCGFDLRGSPSGGCPECGWQRDRVAD